MPGHGLMIRACGVMVDEMEMMIWTRHGRLMMPRICRNYGKACLHLALFPMFLLSVSRYTLSNLMLVPWKLRDIAHVAD